MSTAETITPLPLAAFREHISTFYAEPMRARNTRMKMLQVLRILDEMGVQTTADLTTTFIARFIAERPKEESPNTTFTLMTYLRSLCSQAAAEGWLRVSPFAIRRKWLRRVAPKAPRHYSREELARLLELARREIGEVEQWAQWRARRLYALAGTLAFTGLRKNEALHLRTEDIDLKARMLLVLARRGHRLKTEASAAPVPIPDALAVILEEWQTHIIVPGWLFPTANGKSPWTGGVQGTKPLDQLKDLGRRAGIDGVTFQGFRHSWATHAEHMGLSDLQIQRVLRHTNTRTQRHYLHPDAANLRDQVGRMDFGPPGAAPQ